MGELPTLFIEFADPEMFFISDASFWRVRGNIVSLSKGIDHDFPPWLDVGEGGGRISSFFFGVIKESLKGGVRQCAFGHRDRRRGGEPKDGLVIEELWALKKVFGPRGGKSHW